MESVAVSPCTGQSDVSVNVSHCLSEESETFTCYCLTGWGEPEQGVSVERVHLPLSDEEDIAIWHFSIPVL